MLVAKLASKPFIIMHGTEHLSTIMHHGNALLSTRSRQRIYGDRPNNSNTPENTGNDDTVFFAYKEIPSYFQEVDKVQVNVSQAIENNPLENNRIWSSDVPYCYEHETTLPPVILGQTTLVIRYREIDDKPVKLFEYHLPNGEVQVEKINRGDEISFGSNIPTFRFYRIIEQLRKMDSEYREFVLNNIEDDNIIDAMVRALTSVRAFEINKTVELSLNDESVSIIKADKNKIDPNKKIKMNPAFIFTFKNRSYVLSTGIRLTQLIIKNASNETLQSIIDAGADINYGGISALHCAVLTNNIRITKFLLKQEGEKNENCVWYPANIFNKLPIANKYFTPLEIAKIKQFGEMIKLLEQAEALNTGKKPRAKIDTTQKPLSLANEALTDIDENDQWVLDITQRAKEDFEHKKSKLIKNNFTSLEADLLADMLTSRHMKIRSKAKRYINDRKQFGSHENITLAWELIEKSYADPQSLTNQDLTRLILLKDKLEYNTAQAFEYLSLLDQGNNYRQAMFMVDPNAKNYFLSIPAGLVLLAVVFLHVFLFAIVPIVFNAQVKKQIVLNSEQTLLKKATDAKMPYSFDDFNIHRAPFLKSFSAQENRENTRTTDSKETLTTILAK